jgi:hypothetical protein
LGAETGELMHSQERCSRRSLRRSNPTQRCSTNERGGGGRGGGREEKEEEEEEEKKKRKRRKKQKTKKKRKQGRKTKKKKHLLPVIIIITGTFMHKLWVSLLKFNLYTATIPKSLHL